MNTVCEKVVNSATYISDVFLNSNAKIMMINDTYSGIGLFSSFLRQSCVYKCSKIVRFISLSFTIALFAIENGYINDSQDMITIVLELQH